MLTHLMASGPARHDLIRPGTLSFSLSAHAVLLTGVVYLSINAPIQAARAVEQVTFVEIEEPKAPEQPKAEQPPPPPVVRTEAAPPVPKGFQTLVPPEEPPAEIPEVDTSAPAVSAADFSGIGVAGGRATGDPTVKEAPKEEPPPEDQPGFAFEVAVLESPPQLVNTSQVQSALQRLYPRLLNDAGIEGMVMMEFVITAEGSVDAGTVRVTSSTHDQFSDASVKVIDRMKFRPGVYKGRPVRVLIRMPIAWKPDRT